ncbi:hypothetical protein, partial [Anaerotruncus colihominis]|uniref:hypothetical protein n=1 Tax=Anaerotruncus colihominis TaxID=169435 RepID=UPI0026F37A68
SRVLSFPFQTLSGPSGSALVLSFSLFIFQGAACPWLVGVTLKREFQSIMKSRQSQAFFIKKFKKFYLLNFSTCFQHLDPPSQADFQLFQHFYVENNFFRFSPASLSCPYKKEKIHKIDCNPYKLCYTI